MAPSALNGTYKLTFPPRLRCLQRKWNGNTRKASGEDDFKEIMVWGHNRALKHKFHSDCAACIKLEETQARQNLA